MCLASSSMKLVPPDMISTVLLECPHNRVSGFPERVFKGPRWKLQFLLMILPGNPHTISLQYPVGHMDQPSLLCAGTIKRCGYQEMRIIGGRLGGWLSHLA